MGWSRFFRRRYWDDERAREIQSYIDIETDENIARGMSPEEARCAAHKKFGNGTYVREGIYRMNTIRIVESLWQDLRYTFRSLRRNPGFAVTAIVTLAVGIGANTAVFSVADALIFRPLPYRDPGGLVTVEWASRSSPDRVFPMPHYLAEEIEDWRAQKQIFAGVEPYSAWHNSNSPNGKVGLSPTVSISTAIPGMLGVQPRLGRSFLPEDGQPGRDQVALISDGYWAREFGSDPAVLGKTVTLDNRVYTVVGVMPRNFEFPPGSRPDAWVPWTKESNGSMFSILARLRPGLGFDQARHEAVQVSDRIHLNQELRGKRIPALWRISRRLDPKARTALLVLLDAVGFVFLIACANVANLMLSRGATRQREIAIRAAIGASQGRLLRHFLTESLVLSVAGGMAALLLASFMTRLIFAILPMGLQRLFMGYDSALDARLFAFVCMITILACFLSGLTPAFRAVGGNRIPGLTETSRLAGTTRGIRRFHFVFQSLQVGLALVLLIGAGLMAGSFTRLILKKSGFDSRNLWMVDVSVPPGYKGPQAFSFYNQLKSLVKTIPGVQSATMSIGTPAARGYAGDRFFPEGVPNAEAVLGLEFFVAQDYFATLGIPIIAGRNFDPEEGPSRQVVIIDSRCAATLWPGQSAIGRRLRSDSGSPLLTVVGVATPVKTGAFAEPNNCQLYKPFSRSPFYASLVIRTADNPGPVLAQVRATVAALNPKAKITDTASFDELYAIWDRSVANTPRFYLILMLIFAGVALATAAVGIYGMLSYSVAQRISEIGVRMALGATARDIRMLLIRAVMAPVGTGILLGIITSLWLTRLLRAVLYEISPYDPITIISVIAFLLLVSLAACLLPCRRAARVDPMTALRIE